MKNVVLNKDALVRWGMEYHHPEAVSLAKPSLSLVAVLYHVCSRIPDPQVNKLE